jgi:hypothetical protein
MLHWSCYSGLLVIQPIMAEVKLLTSSTGSEKQKEGTQGPTILFKGLFPII